MSPFHVTCLSGANRLSGYGQIEIVRSKTLYREFISGKFIKNKRNKVEIFTEKSFDGKNFSSKDLCIDRMEFGIPWKIIKFYFLYSV